MRPAAPTVQRRVVELPPETPPEEATPPLSHEPAPARPAAPTVLRRAEEQPSAPPPMSPPAEAVFPAPPVGRGASAVQRQVEEQPPDAHRPSSKVTERLAPPSAEALAEPSVQRRTVPVERAGMETEAEPPAIALQAKGPVPPLAETTPQKQAAAPTPPTAPPHVQRQIGPEERPTRARRRETAAELGEEVLARAASRTHLPLIESGPPTVVRDDSARITPPEARVQARFEKGPFGGEDAATEPAVERTRLYTPSSPAARAAQLPLREPVTVTTQAPTISLARSPETSFTPAHADPHQGMKEGTGAQRKGGGQALVAELPLAPPQVVQRQPSPAVVGEGGWVQREVKATPATGQAAEKEEKSAPDLDHLARQVYPILKRMLAVERERRSGR